VRQLRDMKTTAIIDDFDAADLRAYGRVCGWALARAHARSGDAAAIAGYMGSSEVFDDALCEFAVEYADQAQRDHRAFVRAVRQGRVKAILDT
jgi:NAD(P)H-dependent flavin oxidoreductase YrpB (nitropropane dioxygenase family)